MKRMVVRFDSEPCDVYIGRSSRWGCPFQIGIDGAREEVLLLHEIWLQSRPDIIEAVCRELKGRVLGCHCRPAFECHGDILARIANGAQLCLPLIIED